MKYKQAVFKRIIILCWILLFVCFTIKLFGGNWFEIAIDNKRFIAICGYIQNSFWIYIISFLTYCISMFLFFLAIASKYKFSKKMTIIILLILLITHICTILNPILGIVLDIVITIIFGCFVFRRWKTTIFAIILIFAFQTISAITKNVEIGTTDVLISLIFSIDYYIMLLLFYFYSNLLKGESIMFLGFLFSKNIEQILAYKEVLNTKHIKKTVNANARHAKKIEKLDAKLEKLKTGK